MREHPKIYLIRHGETDWNAERRYQGQSDVPINDNGRAQAKRNGLALRALLPGIAEARYISSPLGRTRETMRIIRRELGLPPGEFTTDERLLELSYGKWQGQLLSDLPRTDPGAIEARNADPFQWRPGGGENYTDLTKRLTDWLDNLACDENYVVVSHGGVSRALRFMLLEDVEHDDILNLDVPQDRILLLENGVATWL